jgi:hypothetical protein
MVVVEFVILQIGEVFFRVNKVGTLFFGGLIAGVLCVLAEVGNQAVDEA